jgi:hypothetical protein
MERFDKDHSGTIEVDEIIFDNEKEQEINEHHKNKHNHIKKSSLASMVNFILFKLRILNGTQMKIMIFIILK